jgi:hypothetical protein
LSLTNQEATTSPVPPGQHGADLNGIPGVSAFTRIEIDLVESVKLALGTDLSDGRTVGVNIATYRRTKFKSHTRQTLANGEF